MDQSSNTPLLEGSVIVVVVAGVVAAFAATIAQRLLFGTSRIAATLAVVMCAVLGASGLSSLRQRKSE